MFRGKKIIIAVLSVCLVLGVWLSLDVWVSNNLSRITSIKSFHNNVIANSELTTRVTEGTTTIYVTVEDRKSVV